MAQANMTISGKSVSPVSGPTAYWFRLGWQDKATGAAFHHAYDTWASRQQTAYESGRMFSLIVHKEMGVWLAPPTAKNYEVLAAIGQDFFKMQTEMVEFRAGRQADLARAQLAEHGICEVY